MSQSTEECMATKYRHQRDALLDALMTALPFVEDHEGSKLYKTGAVAQVVAKIKKAIRQAGVEV